MYTKLCTKLWVALGNLKDDARGVTALEYAILAAIVIAAIVAGLTTLDIGGLFSNLKDTIDSATTATGGS